MPIKGWIHVVKNDDEQSKSLRIRSFQVTLTEDIIQLAELRAVFNNSENVWAALMDYQMPVSFVSNNAYRLTND